MRSPNILKLSALATAIAGVGCGFSPQGTGVAGVGGAVGAGSAGRMTGLGGFGGVPGIDAGGAGARSDGGLSCGAYEMPSTKLLPDILIVLDRSGSMNQDPTTGMNCNTAGCSKWDQTAGALDQVVTSTDATVNWGLKLFGSTTSGCNVNTMTEVPIAPMNAAAVTGRIGMTQRGSSTPTRAGMTNATTYLRTVTTPNPKFILLATDGLPNCPATGNQADPDATAAVQAVADAATAGFRTFVVGIATASDPTADTTLSQMADAGGVPRVGVTPAYYPVASQAELVDAFSQIITIAASCTFPVPNPPTMDGTTSRGDIRVTADGSPLPQDANNGWTYTGADMTSIELHGTACEMVKAGNIQMVTIIFNCHVP